jgi:hypothetical protein
VSKSTLPGCIGPLMLAWSFAMCLLNLVHVLSAPYRIAVIVVACVGLVIILAGYSAAKVKK